MLFHNSLDSGKIDLPTDKNFGKSDGESFVPNIGDSSKIVYVNDSFNLDTIPFDVKIIVEEMSDDEIE